MLLEVLEPNALVGSIKERPAGGVHGVLILLSVGGDGHVRTQVAGNSYLVCGS